MNYKVMIIEDDPATLEVMVCIVESVGMKAVSFTRIPSLAEVEGIGPYLIILDHWLPNGYGGDFCLALKASPPTANIRVIIMSAVLNVAAVAACSQADDMFAKPFDIDDLSVMILSQRNS